ncbi:MAG: hypothetical protein IH840_04025 [Candidatus Heimdallarchaeota archaeon]|nr:hypothetical protein [Candidatus Heimdallarchaeota archaeon]
MGNTVKGLLNQQDRELKKNFDGKILGFSLRGNYSEKDYTLTSTYNFELPNKVKIQVGLPDGKTYTEGYDGSKSWELTEYVDERASAALKQGAEWPNFIKSIKDFVKNGHSAELAESATIRGISCYGIKLTQKDGFTRIYYLDTENYEIRFAEDVRPLHPTDEVKFIRTEWSEFKTFAGVKIATKSIQRDIDTDIQMSELITETVVINPEFAQDEFERLTG